MKQQINRLSATQFNCFRPSYGTGRGSQEPPPAQFGHEKTAFF